MFVQRQDLCIYAIHFYHLRYNSYPDTARGGGGRHELPGPAAGPQDMTWAAPTIARCLVLLKRLF